MGTYRILGSPRTAWDVSLEETSTRKAQIYKERYEASIGKDTAFCLGSYVFMWDVKQERTHTWFSMFIDTGEELSMVDALHYLWTGKPPVNSSPVVEPLQINGKMPQDNVVLDATSIHTASIKAFDAEDSLQYRWEILPELTGYELNEGGEGETKPEIIKGLYMSSINQAQIQFKAPPVEGPYRMFVYVLDGHHHVATANIPFYVIP
ncbi:hypothetical protein GXP67_33400 [Rhodocytophaga rosea]|uniref:Uncharacterized protein n=1 Tax=Rhodocytophaga rosea TaxID=2704465 RepID=A0A6C0GV39_9BACT|nr:hypothetical protein [Rhodocytophaga rosea]QHT71202.1 hypothetical protein GXP67_33400 [Rhodocytophaga rosea]